MPSKACQTLQFLHGLIFCFAYDPQNQECTQRWFNQDANEFYRVAEAH
jgi:hypothetical protein